jgi:hypothetical protein
MVVSHNAGAPFPFPLDKPAVATVEHRLGRRNDPQPAVTLTSHSVGRLTSPRASRLGGKQQIWQMEMSRSHRISIGLADRLVQYT